MIIVETMTDQILPIRAEERLELITDHAVASGAVKKHAAQSHQRRLSRYIRSESRAATAAELLGIGIKIDA